MNKSNTIVKLETAVGLEIQISKLLRNENSLIKTPIAKAERVFDRIIV